MTGFKLPKFLSVTFFLLALVSSARAWGDAQKSCHAIHLFGTESYEASVEELRQHRMLQKNRSQRHSSDPELRFYFNRNRQELQSGDEVTIGGVHYSIEGFLGESSALVYRARAANGSLVVVKSINSQRMFTFEVRLTEFLLAQGFEVPKIIGTQGLQIVKEYFPGLTEPEVRGLFRHGEQARFGWRESDSRRLNQELQALHRRYQALVANQFALWLQQNYPADHRVLSENLGSLLHFGDEKLDNYLYSFSHRRWRKYDP